MLRDFANKIQQQLRILNCNNNKYWLLGGLIVFVLIRLYIFSSFLNIRPIVVSFDAEAEKEISYQAFYTNNMTENFGGSNVVTYKAQAGKNHIEIILPTEKIAKLRLDLGSFPGKIQLKNIKVRGLNTVTISDENFLRLNQLKVQSPQAGYFNFYSDQGDPYFVYTKTLNLSTRFIDWLPSLLFWALLCVFLCKILYKGFNTLMKYRHTFIFNKDRIVTLFRQIDFKDTFLISLFILLFLLSYIQPNLDAPLSIFNRIIGQGVINNYDVNLIIRNFYIYFLLTGIIYIGTSFVFTFIFRYLNTKENASTSRNDLDIWCIVGICYALFCYIAGKNLSDNMLGSILNLILAVIICKIVSYLLNKNININKFNLYVYSTLCFSIYLIFSGISDEDIITISIKFIVVGTIIFYLFPQLFKQTSIYRFNLTTATVLCIPLLTSLFTETIYILNRYEIFITNFRTSYTLFITTLLIIALINDIKNKLVFEVTKLYPIIVIGFAFLSFQMPLIRSVWADLFETANSSIAISSFFNNGELPVFHHFGAHMLSSIVSSIVYGVLNNDYYGAIFSPYGAYLYNPLVMILFYYVTLKVTQNKDVSILVSLFFPVMNTIIRPFFAFGLLVILPVYNYIEKNSYTNAMLIMISCLIVFFYRIDIGVSFIIASGCALLWATESKTYLYKLVITGIATVLSIAALYFIICILYEISPFQRLQEFFYVVNSNPTWGYNSIFNSGDERNFNIFYLLFPIIVIYSLVYLMLSGKSLDVEKSVKVILLILGIAYIINFQRGIVRHSLREQKLMFAWSSYLLWSGYLFIIYFFTVLYKPKKIFVPLVITALFIENVFLNKPVNEYSIITQTMRNITQIDNEITTVQNYNKDKKIVDRVKIGANILTLKEKMEKIMNNVLKSNETYLDFSNHTFLYSLLKRRCPVYVSQSPGLLSGEESQNYFVNEIEANIDEIPLALLPYEHKMLSTGVDGIMNNIRYYKVSEFIYQNYRPMFRNEHYAFWIKNDKYDDIKTRIKEMEDIKEIDALYNKEYRIYNLIDLAYLWGDEDKNNASTNKPLRQIELQKGNKHTFNLLKSDEKVKGNYILLKIDAPYDDKARLYIGTEEKNRLSTFNFNVKTGIHTYLLRVSADSLWYLLDINNIELDLNKNHTLLKMSILEGD